MMHYSKRRHPRLAGQFVVDYELEYLLQDRSEEVSRLVVFTDGQDILKTRMLRGHLCQIDWEFKFINKQAQKETGGKCVWSYVQWCLS